MRAGIFWNQNLSVLIDGLHNERQNLCLDVSIIYSFEMTIHWETEYCIYYGDKPNKTSHTFCLWQGIILRCISTFMWNWNSTFCTPGVHRTLIMYSQTGLANQFDLSLICLMTFPHQFSLPATINCLPCTILQCTTYTKLSYRKRLNS